MTAPEKRLWLQLRAKRLAGAKFRRQQVIGRYIADFACRAPMIVVEVDGETHAERAEQDTERTAFLEGQGYKVLRFTNADVMANLEGVLETITAALPLPFRGKGRGEGEE
jgi:very-short-patch-repair endonuclease